VPFTPPGPITIAVQMTLSFFRKRKTALKLFLRTLASAGRCVDELAAITLSGLLDVASCNYIVASSENGYMALYKRVAHRTESSNQLSPNNVYYFLRSGRFKLNAAIEDS